MSRPYPFTIQLAPPGRLAAATASGTRAVALRASPHVPDAVARNTEPGFEKKNAVVLGVSPDDEHSHKKFIEKYKIPYALLCDIDHKVASIYGVWEEKQFMGKVSMGLMRSTFIIDENGLVSKAFFKVSPDAHYEMLLKQL